MHRVSRARSGRLPRVHALLADGRGHSAHDVVGRARACATNGIVAALRDSGGRVEAIWRAFNGTNYAALALKHRLTVRQIRRIVERMRRRGPGI